MQWLAFASLWMLYQLVEAKNIAQILRTKFFDVDPFLWKDSISSPEEGLHYRNLQMVGYWGRFASIQLVHYSGEIIWEWRSRQ